MPKARRDIWEFTTFMSDATFGRPKSLCTCGTVLPRDWSSDLDWRTCRRKLRLRMQKMNLKRNGTRHDFGLVAYRESTTAARSTVPTSRRQESRNGNPDRLGFASADDLEPKDFTNRSSGFLIPLIEFGLKGSIPQRNCRHHGSSDPGSPALRSGRDLRTAPVSALSFERLSHASSQGIHSFPPERAGPSVDCFHHSTDENRRATCCVPLMAENCS